MKIEEENRLVRLGSSLWRIILHDDCKFYREDDKNKENPLKVLPVPNGFTIINLWEYLNDEYGPPKQYELYYELGRELEKLVGSNDVQYNQFGVRIGIPESNAYPVDFYRIIN